MVGSTFQLLFVCHANLCRSPLAERLALHAYGRITDEITVSSAGTHAYEGTDMHVGSATVLAECGLDPGGFRSRRLTATMVERSDLVLTAAKHQRAACVQLVPAMAQRVFTLRQFARLAAVAGPAPDMAALVTRANAVRHRVGPGDDDLPDPVGQSVETFRACAEEIWSHLQTITSSLSDPGRRPTG